MSNLTDFFPSGGGGGLTPKFQEFNASGTFTPSQALIDAGGYIELFLVGGGGRSGGGNGAGGGEVFTKKMYLTSVSSCSVNIGSGGLSNYSNGASSSFSGASAGGVDLVASGGRGNGSQANALGAAWGCYTTHLPAGSGVSGYGAGGGHYNLPGGIYQPKANSGQGGSNGQNGGSGYCLIKWYE